MGDVSIIARRLADGHVQYGWSGNGGYFRVLGQRLLVWYYQRKNPDYPDIEDMIEYLFSIGQFEFLGKPKSEKGGLPMVYSTFPTGEPHWLGTSERQIFSQIAFIDYGYFFDTDNKWYYVKPGPFRIKIPLELIYNNVDKDGFEFKFLDNVEKMLLKFLLEEYSSPKFEALIQRKKADKKEILSVLMKDDWPVHKLFDDFKWLFKFFDDWVVVKPDSEYKKVSRFIVKEKTEKHIETCYW